MSQSESSDEEPGFPYLQPRTAVWRGRRKDAGGKDKSTEEGLKEEKMEWILYIEVFLIVQEGEGGHAEQFRGKVKIRWVSG